MPVRRLPDPAGIAVGFGIGVDDDDLRMAVRTGRGRVDGQRAEAAAEGLVLVEVHFLIAEKDDLMFHQGVVDFLEGLVAHRLPKIGAEYLSPDIRRHRPHFDVRISHTAHLS